MGNDNQFVEQPLPAFVNPTTATPTVTSKDGIIAFQTPVEPMESRQTLLNENTISTKTRSPATSFSVSADKIFALALLVLLIILIAYLLFHGKHMENKLNRLNTNTDLKSNDLRSLLEEVNLRVKAIERLLDDQSKRTNINVQLNGQDVRAFSTNQTVLQEFLRRLRDRQWISVSSLSLPLTWSRLQLNLVKHVCSFFCLLTEQIRMENHCQCMTGSFHPLRVTRATKLIDRWWLSQPEAAWVMSVSVSVSLT